MFISVQYCLWHNDFPGQWAGKCELFLLWICSYWALEQVGSLRPSCHIVGLSVWSPTSEWQKQLCKTKISKDSLKVLNVKENAQST